MDNFSNNICARQSKYNSWISRDYKEISCLAVGCKYNVNEFCGVPTRAKFNNEAKCEGFEARKDKGKTDGD